MLCSFCPCKNGNKVKRAATPRERKETGSQPHCGAPKVGVLYKSFRRHSLNFFRKNLTKRRCEGRCHEVTEGIRKPGLDRTNLKLWHKSAKRASLVMRFLPLLGAECRAGKEGNFAPNGAKREARYSGAALRAHAVVSPLKFSASTRCFCFACKRKATKQRCMGRCHGVTEGIRGLGNTDAADFA